MKAVTIDEIKQMILDGTLEERSKAKRDEIVAELQELSPTVPAMHFHVNELILAKPRPDIADLRLTGDSKLSATKGVVEWLKDNGCIVVKERDQETDTFYIDSEPYVSIGLKDFSKP